jgi:hypothetical protein
MPMENRPARFTIGFMGKRKPMKHAEATEAASESKRFPSRENTRYVGLPIHLYELVEQFAKDHSDEYDEKSISWAARILIHKALTAEGYMDKDNRKRPARPEGP